MGSGGPLFLFFLWLSVFVGILDNILFPHFRCGRHVIEEIVEIKINHIVKLKLVIEFDFFDIINVGFVFGVVGVIDWLFI